MKWRETETVEFKKSTSELKEGVISLASMLNKHQKGTLYFGVQNDGTVVGQMIGMHTTSDILRAIRTQIRPMVVPQIEVLEIDVSQMEAPCSEGKEKQMREGVKREVIKIEVCGEDTPYAAYGRYYVRSDDEDLMMTNAQLESYFFSRNFDYSKWEREATPYGIDDVDEELLIRYVNEGIDQGRLDFLHRDVQTTLAKLDLLQGDRLNQAGYYLFSKHKPLLLKLAIFPTEERISFVDMKQFRGNIFECIQEAMRYIKQNIRWKAEIKGMKRVETPEIPIEEIREIVVNSFAHMRVNPSISNEIYLTPTRVRIYNPGPLVPGTSPEMFANGEKGSMIRNPLIATVLYYNKTIDAFGSGFERVFKLCAPGTYRYHNDSFGFAFAFLRPSVGEIAEKLRRSEGVSHVDASSTTLFRGEDIAESQPITQPRPQAQSQLQGKPQPKPQANPQSQDRKDSGGAEAFSEERIKQWIDEAVQKAIRKGVAYSFPDVTYSDVLAREAEVAYGTAAMENGEDVAPLPKLPRFTEDEKTVLLLLGNPNQYHTKEDIAAQIGKSVSTVSRIVKSLTEKRLIRRVGSNKTGYWRVRDEVKGM